MPRLAHVLLPLFLIIPVACDNEISSASQLRRVRLLAVQAEPPNPAFGQATQLRSLVYLPPGEAVTYEWSWCPVPTVSDNGYACPVDQAAVDALAARAGLTGVPPLSLGTTETVVFTNPFPPALLAGLCAGDSTTTSLFFSSAAEVNGQGYSCSVATLSVQVMLTVRGSITDTGVVSLRLPIDDTTPGNANPVIAGVSVVSQAPAGLLDETGLVAVPRDKKVKLRVGVDQTQAEEYLDRQLGPDDAYEKDDAGRFILGPTRERLSVFWFSEGGGFIDRTTGWGAQDLDGSGQPLAFDAGVENDWTTPKVDAYGARTSLVLVVVRDSRGGVGWTRGIATLEDAP